MSAPTIQFLADVRAVVVDHYSGLPEDRPSEAVYARLDHVLFDDDGLARIEPDYEAALQVREVATPHSERTA